MGSRSIEALIERMDIVSASIAAGQRELFRLIVEASEHVGWEEEGARDLAHWVCLRYGVSEWKAHRWIDAAIALEQLPRLSEAFETGVLGIDKVVEVCRFATPEDEQRLVRWARTVSGAWISRKADLLERQRRKDAEAAERERQLNSWFAGDRFRMELEASRAVGVRIMKRLRTVAEEIPVLPGEEGSSARLADAAVVLLTSSADSQVASQSTVVIHARLDDLLSAERAAALEGEAVSPETARRALCHSRFRLLLEDERGEPLKLGRLRRDPTPAMRELVLARDGGCTFPNCEARRFLEVHHVQSWGRGGPTDVERLATICSFHHKLLHEYGWRIERTSGGRVRWYRPDGTRYRAGPAPPEPIEDPADYGSPPWYPRGEYLATG